MIGYLRGEIIEHSDGKMLVGVDAGAGSSSRVGYSVSVPQSGVYGAYIPGQMIELFIHTHVREEALDLFGFNSKFEKSLFLTLLGVNGIGPKSALSILSGVESSQLVEAIIQGDQAFLTQVPGIGKKTAERVVVELRDSVRKKMDSGYFVKDLNSSSSQKNTSEKGGHKSGENKFRPSDIFRDAKAALLGLGYLDGEVHHLLNRILDDSEVPPRRAEELIRTALRQLA